MTNWNCISQLISNFLKFFNYTRTEGDLAESHVTLVKVGKTWLQDPETLHRQFRTLLLNLKDLFI